MRSHWSASRSCRRVESIGQCFESVRSHSVWGIFDPKSSYAQIQVVFETIVGGATIHRRRRHAADCSESVVYVGIATRSARAQLPKRVAAGVKNVEELKRSGQGGINIFVSWPTVAVRPGGWMESSARNQGRGTELRFR